MDIYLIRHGQKQHGTQPFLEGWYDPPLTELGHQQAAATGQRLLGCGITRILTSDLTRTRQTAKGIQHALNAPLTADAGLREIFMGDWEGQPFETLSEMGDPYYQAWGEHHLDLPYPNGESGAQVFLRVERVLQELAHKTEGSAAVITHGGVVRCLVSGIIGLPMEKRYSLDLANCSITLLRRDDETGRLRLISLNDCSHLKHLQSW